MTGSAIKRLYATTSIMAIAVALGAGSAQAQNHTVNGTAEAGYTNSGALDYILIENGALESANIVNTGTIAPPDGTNAITITGSTLMGAVVNSGKITASNAETAISIVNSTVSGGVTNSGTITNTGTAFATPYGLNVSGTGSFGGNIVNTAGGLVNVTNSDPAGDSATGIYVSKTSFGGSIVNSGTIAASAAVSGSAAGVHLAGTLFSGGITNSGAISGVSAAESGAGIYVGAGTFTGGITNSGTITGIGGGEYGDGYGVCASGQLFTSGIVNSGTVIAKSADCAVAMAIDSDTFAGGINNSNFISASTTGSGNATALGIMIDNSSFSGGIVNSGTISAVNNGSSGDAYGISIYDTIFADGITNLAGGTISAVNNGSSGDAYGIYACASYFTGGINNAGTIAATAPGHAVGIQAGYACVDGSNAYSSNSLFTGGITNSGLITATSTKGTATGVAVFGQSFAGGIANSGTITVSGVSQAIGLNIGYLGSGGSSYAGVTSFGGGITNSGTISATATTGYAAGIAISAYTFTGGITNSGLISAVSNLANASGIWVGACTFSGGITNTGTISAKATTGYAAGIDIGHIVTTFSGGINNSGLISARSTSGNASAIYIGACTFAGGITNSGTISASANSYAAGIYIENSIFTGGITNSGKITATSSTADATAIDINNYTFTGGITNSGTISASAVNYAAGLDIDAYYSFSGGINNSGLISATSSAGDATAVYVESDTFAGGITNTGTIRASANSYAYGLDIYVNSFSGGITNSGLISATSATKDATAVYLSSSVYAGGIANSGTIVASAQTDALAISVTGSTFTGGIKNTGTIMAVGPSFAEGLYVSDSSFSGGITNAGLISAVSSGGKATGIGLYSYRVDSGITNSGTITATGNTGAVGIYITNQRVSSSSGYALALQSFGGGINNSGLISATATGTAAPATAIYVGVCSFTGGIVNSGTISASAAGNAIALQIGNSHATSNDQITQSFSGGISNSGLIQAVSSAAKATGIGIYACSFSGGITNSGTISVTGHTGARGLYVYGGYQYAGMESFDGGIANSGLISASTQAGNAVGIYVFASTFTGGISNSGRITASSVSGSATGVHLGSYGSSYFGGISNSGTIVASGVGAMGINVYAYSFTGDIANSGKISATSTGDGTAVGVNVSVSYFDGNIINTGVIAASSAAGNAYGIKINGGEFEYFNGAIINGPTGIISGIAKTGSGYGIYSSLPIGAIINSGTITGSTAAIDLSTANGSTVISQNAGIIYGQGDLPIAMNLSAYGDTVNIAGGIVQGSITDGGDGGDTATVNLTGGTLQLLMGKAGTSSNQAGTAAAPLLAFNQGGGTLQVQVNPTPLATYYVNAVTASLAGTLAAQELPGYYTNSQTYLVVNGTGGLTGTYSNLTTSSPLFKETAAYTGTTADLTLTRVPFNQVPGLTPQEQAVASGLEGLYDNGGGNPSGGTKSFLSPFFGLNSPNYRAALNSLVPTINQASVTTQINVLDTFLDTIENRMAGGASYDSSYVQSAGLHNGQFQLANAGNASVVTDAGYQQQQTSQLNVPDISASNGTTGVWMRGYGVFGNAGALGSQPGYSESRGGVIGGADYQLTDALRLGVAADYGHTNINFDSSVGSTGVDNFEVAAYGHYQPGSWYVNGVASFGWNSFQSNRNTGFGTADGNYSGQTYGAYGETGYDIKLDQVNLRPLLGLQYTHSNTGSYTENGGGASDLTLGSTGIDSLLVEPGVRVNMRFDIEDVGTLIPEVRAMWQHELENTSQNIAAGFANAPGGNFTVQGVAQPRDSAVLGFGTTLEMSSAVRLFLDYDAKINSNYTAHAISAGFRMQF